MIPDEWSPYLGIWLIIRSQKAQCKNIGVMWPLFQQLHNTYKHEIIKAMPSYRFYLRLCQCFLYNKNVPVKSVYKVGSYFTNGMTRREVEGRAGREVRDEAEKGRRRRRASTQLLHLGHRKTTAFVAGEPLCQFCRWRKSQTELSKMSPTLFEAMKTISTEEESYFFEKQRKISGKHL